jgi:signal transduction histidine kinase
MELALQQARKELTDASRIAGRAEIANSVLHSVGTVLNSLNVSASILADGLRRSKVGSLAKVAALLREHQADLGRYLTADPKGSRIPELIASLARHALDERNRLLEEITQLQAKIDQIKEIVSMQQAYASLAGVIEPLAPETLLDDALRINAGDFPPDLQIERDYPFAPAVLGEKPKVLQILVNLIQNARHACDAAARPDKRVALRIRTSPTSGRVSLIVEDNGVGIPAENLTRIFNHGFTTRPAGHGFALHSAANAAQEMKGVLSAASAGPGQGATFTLELPVAPAAIPAE